MLFPFPERFERDIRSLEAQIRTAFRGVTRDGGISWTESAVIDGRGTDKNREHARTLDNDQRWEDLIDNPTWNFDSGSGGFSFLDPISFRYYLAPAMIRSLRPNDRDARLACALTLSTEHQRDRARTLTPQQAHTVARFLRTMAAANTAAGDSITAEAWTNAYHSYWRHWDRGAQPK